MTVLALPRRKAVPDAVLGMALFLFTEAMLFAGLVSAYLVLRGRAFLWPPPDQPRLPVEATAFNTALLVASGAFAWRIVDRWDIDGRRGAARALATTLGLGLAFLAVQGTEWVGLIAYGLDAAAGSYGATFTAIVGTHAVHALGGAAALAWGLWAIRRNGAGRDALRAVRMYWLFVVAVWPPLYALVYLW